MLRALLFLLGGLLTVAGLALWSVPLALVVAGVGLCVVAFVLERDVVREKAAR